MCIVDFPPRQAQLGERRLSFGYQKLLRQKGLCFVSELLHRSYTLVNLLFCFNDSEFSPLVWCIKNVDIFQYLAIYTGSVGIARNYYWLYQITNRLNQLQHPQGTAFSLSNF